MRRFHPGLLVFSAALIASLCVHLPVYQVLGALAEVLLADSPEPTAPTTIEFELASTSEDVEDAEETDETEREPPPPAVPPPAVPPPSPVKAPAPERAKPERVKVVQATPPPATPTPPSPPDQRRLAVTQKSEDPDVEPPPDAQFLAEENRRVAEQTVARLRNMQVDEEPEPSASAESDQSVTHAGDAADTEVADLKEQAGEDARAARPEEAVAERRQHVASAGDVQASSEAKAESARVTDARPKVTPGGPPVAEEQAPLIIHDGLGTVAIKRAKPGPSISSQAGERPPGARSRQEGGRRASNARRGVDLRVSWNQFENTFGSDELARQRRQAQVAQERSRLRGSGRGQRWRRFKAAIENFVPNVKPGNQTALNAAADPFAHYLATIHRNIHRQFAMGFLRNLPAGGGAFDDSSLHTKLEISINRDGSLHKVGIVYTSGFMPFDYGAFDAVVRAGPFAAPPRKILSGDGRVYMHWGFYRNHRQCGTFNASPFILKGPAGGAPPGPTDNDPPDAEFGLREFHVPHEHGDHGEHGEHGEHGDDQEHHDHHHGHDAEHAARRG